MWRVFVVVACALPLGPAAQAEEDAGTAPAEMACEPVAGPGRVLCSVEARVGAGEAIASGDVLLVRTPPFVTALRGRIGPHDATTRGARLWRWAFGLAARARGAGTIEGRVRLVVCRGPVCEPREVPVSARVVVGDVPK